MKRPTRIVNLYQDPYEVYVERPHDGTDPRDLRPGEHGFLGNPFVSDDPLADQLDFKRYFLRRMKTDRQFRLAVESIKGLTLGSFCERQPSHAEVIVAYLDGQLMPQSV